MRNGRMEVERDVEGLCPLKNGPEAPVVQENAVGEAVDHRALKAEGGHGPIELGGGGFGIGRWQRGEGGEAVGVERDGLGQAVVGAASHPDGGLGVKPLDRWCAVREDLDVDAGGVHVLEPRLSDVIELVEHLRLRRRV